MDNWALSVTIIAIAICTTIYYVTRLRLSNPAGEIEKLGELKEKGLLTEQEFEKRKRKILKS